MESTYQLIGYIPPYTGDGDGNRFGRGIQEGAPDIQGVRRLYIEVKHKNWESLIIHRRQSLSAKRVIHYKDKYVPGKIRFQDDTYKVKLRFKGNIAHLKQDKWSFRILVKGKKTILGMKQFSIQHPLQRNWMLEKLAHLSIKREGLLGLRYDFIYVTINGKNMGIYALEEHFEKRLIENNQRKNGPVIKIASSALTFFDAAKSGVVQRDPVLYQQYQKATQLLRALVKGELTVSEVFDVKKLAKYCAIVDLLGGGHGAHWSSLRLYYNPITSKLETIYYDGNTDGYFNTLIGAGRSFFQSPGNRAYPIFNILFDDPVFFKNYVVALEKVSEKSYLDNLLTDLGGIIDRDEKLLASEWVNYSFTKKSGFVGTANDNNVSRLYKTREKIRLIVSGQGFQQKIQLVTAEQEIVQAHHQMSISDKITLGLISKSPMPIEILGIRRKNILHKPLKPAILPTRIPTTPGFGNYANVTLVDDPRPRLVYFSSLDFRGEDITSLMLSYRVMGSSFIREVSISPIPIEGVIEDASGETLADEIHQPSTVSDGSSDTITRDIIREKSNLDKYEFLDVRDSIREITIRRGAWKLSRNLVIPKGYKLIAKPGTKIDLSNGAILLSYSPISFIGTEDDPIIIQSPGNDGGGLAVLNADGGSFLRHTIFKNLSAPESEGWKLTGAVTFYESDVHVENCQFIGNHSEDSLHIMRSKVQISDSYFKNAQSDAFDGDFVEARIERSQFVNSGNDAVDISGSSLIIKDIQIDGAGDKGLSAGENSKASVERIKIKSTNIAIASKDMSTVIAKDISIKNSKIGFAAYQKKSEFGPATIKTTRVIDNTSAAPFMLEPRSTLLMDGVVKTANQKKAYKALYPKTN